MAISHSVSELVEKARQAQDEASLISVLARLDTALASSHPPQDRAELVTARLIVGSAASRLAIGQDDRREALRLSMETYHLLEEGEAGEIDEETRVVTAGNLATLFRELGAFRLSAQLGRQAFAASLEGVRRDALAVFGLSLAETMLLGPRHLVLSGHEARQWADAAAHAALAIVQHAETDRDRSVLGQGVMAEVCVARNDVAGARTHLDAALQAADRANDPFAANLMLTEAMVLQREGRLVEAIDRFDLAEPSLRHQWQRHCQLLAERGDAHTDTGNWKASHADSQARAQLMQRHSGTDVDHAVTLSAGMKAPVAAESAAPESAPEPDRSELIERLKSDELTGVGSYSWLTLAMGERQSSVGICPVLILDIDSMRMINDQHDLSVGDDVLHTVGEVLVAQCRDADVVARSGGNRFVVLPAAGGLADALALAERLRASVTSVDWQSVAPGLAVTVSVGVSSGLAQDVRNTQREAEAYLHQAKLDGRNRVAGPGHAGVSILSASEPALPEPSGAI